MLPGNTFRAETEVGIEFSAPGLSRSLLWWGLQIAGLELNVLNPAGAGLQPPDSTTQLPCALNIKYLATLWIPPNNVFLKWKLKEVSG